MKMGLELVAMTEGARLHVIDGATLASIRIRLFERCARQHNHGILSLCARLVLRF